MLEWISTAKLPSMPLMIKKMKHSPMLPISRTRHTKAFSCSTIGPNFRPAIIVEIKGMSVHSAKSILLQRQMALFPLQVRNGPICQHLPLPKIAVISFREIQNSRHFSLLFQPSPPNILLSHNLMTMKMRPQLMIQMMLQISMMTRMMSTLFWEWWEL